jgi:NAD(P)-dependent dehydrogenase (short-subunit alcohol dehydrogenase family)
MRARIITTQQLDAAARRRATVGQRSPRACGFMRGSVQHRSRRLREPGPVRTAPLPSFQLRRGNGMTLEGRVALVTGGGRGIVAGIAQALAADGAAVAINYRRDEAAARATLEAITAAGGRAAIYQGSVDDAAVMASMVEQIIADFGPIDILVNNAGIASRGQSVFDTDPAEMERVVRVHAFGPFTLAKLVLPGMRTRPRGDIVMISSSATRKNVINGAPYNMGKAAMESLAFTLAREELKHNIRVNIVAPGMAATDMGDRLAKARHGTESVHELDAFSAFGRICTPEDVANVVRFLVSDLGSYVSGQRIYVDAGSDGPDFGNASS